MLGWVYKAKTLFFFLLPPVHHAYISGLPPPFSPLTPAGEKAREGGIGDRRKEERGIGEGFNTDLGKLLKRKCGPFLEDCFNYDTFILITM